MASLNIRLVKSKLKAQRASLKCGWMAVGGQNKAQVATSGYIIVTMAQLSSTRTRALEP